jgi:hypothetical protein
MALRPHDGDYQMEERMVVEKWHQIYGHSLSPNFRHFTFVGPGWCEGYKSVVGRTSALGAEHIPEYIIALH